MLLVSKRDRPSIDKGVQSTKDASRVMLHMSNPPMNQERQVQLKSLSPRQICLRLLHHMIPQIKVQKPAIPCESI